MPHLNKFLRRHRCFSWDLRIISSYPRYLWERYRVWVNSTLYSLFKEIILHLLFPELKIMDFLPWVPFFSYNFVLLLGTLVFCQSILRQLSEWRYWLSFHKNRFTASENWNDLYCGWVLLPVGSWRSWPWGFLLSTCTSFWTSEDNKIINWYKGTNFHIYTKNGSF